MKYTRNGIFTYIDGKMNTAEHPMYCTTSYENVPPSFPALHLSIVDKVPVKARETFGCTEQAHEWNIEAQIYSDKKNGAESELYALSDRLESVMREMNFVGRSFGFMRVQGESLTRIVSRFSRIIGTDDEMPELPTENGENNE